jgi:hypothetical protein
VCRKATAIGIFNARETLTTVWMVVKRGLARVAAIGYDPIDRLGGCIDTGLDAAAPLLYGRCGDEFGGRSVA